MQQTNSAVRPAGSVGRFGRFSIDAAGIVIPLGPTDGHIPSDAHARAFLMRFGNLDVQGSRYGRDVASCAEVALAVHRRMVEHGGEAENTYRGLDGDMADVLSDEPDVGAVLAA